MPKVLVVYYSQTGNTEKMTCFIAEGLKSGSAEADVRRVEDVSTQQLVKYDGIIVGSPVYYGSMVAPVKKMFDDSIAIHGKLDGKVGAAFSSSANIAGGNETAIADIINAMLIHGMVIQGDPKGDHYGPVAINIPDERTRKQCIRLGQRVAGLVLKLTEKEN
ncbi:NAD(P)H-dependent oxidoreductase [candidate division WOR-3 bacterium]|nr:NAD(P)H-dependent oxidoreductase [candidate division WOR-3 bacterium]